jgi:hypothetical protein
MSAAGNRYLADYIYKSVFANANQRMLSQNAKVLTENPLPRVSRVLNALTIVQYYFAGLLEACEGSTMRGAMIGDQRGQESVLGKEI